MGHTAYIVKCQYTCPGIKTFTQTGLICRSREAKKFTKAQVEEKAKEKFTKVLERIISDSDTSKTVADFKMKITLKGVSTSFIDCI